MYEKCAVAKHGTAKVEDLSSSAFDQQHQKGPEKMNENTETNETMDTKEPSTESPAKATPGADHVFQVFKDIGTPVTMLVWAAVAMLLVFCVGSVEGFLTSSLSFASVFSFIVQALSWCCCGGGEVSRHYYTTFSEKNKGTMVEK